MNSVTNSRDRATCAVRPVYAVTWVVLSLVLICCGACGDSGANPWRFPRFSQSDSRGDLDVAANDPSPDKRRKAIQRIARTRNATDDAVVTVLSEIAVNDSSQTVRVCAIEALTRSCNPTATAAATTILSKKDDATTASAAPAVEVAAMDLLTGCADVGNLDDTAKEKATARAITVLNAHRSRQVRIAAAQFLGYVPRREALDALVESLAQRDFGVVYEAERSLMRLTGKTHEHDVREWKAFVESTPDPFANRGALDHQLENEDPNWWQKQRQKWQKLNFLAGKNKDK